MMAASAYVGSIPRTISFDITAASAGYSTGDAYPGLVTKEANGKSWFRIIVNSPLPLMTKPGIYIDGDTQTREASASGCKKIEIRSVCTTEGTAIFEIAGNGTDDTIKGLAINSAKTRYFGVNINGGQNDNIVSCYLGETATGEGASPVSLGYGVYISNEAQGNIVQDNVVGNTMVGILMKDPGTINNEVSGNYIGTDAGGTFSILNMAGVACWSSSSNRIGTPAKGNLISGNAQFGIYIIMTSEGNSICNNLIGLNASGTGAVTNEVGVEILSSNNNTIGGTAAGCRNVVTGNMHGGIIISDSQGNAVLGNYIGTTANGLSGLGQYDNYFGIGLADSIANKIGDGTEAGRNVISGNQKVAIYSTSDTVPSSSNEVNYNLIGVAADLTPLGNGLAGLYFEKGSNHDRICRNIIANNGGGGPMFISWGGIFVTGSDTSSETISQNSIYSNASDEGIFLVSDANRDIPTPEVISTQYNFTTRALTLTGHSTPNAVVEVFKAASSEGQIYLGSVTSNGSGMFNGTLPMVLLAKSDSIVVTATDVLGDTSTFSPPVMVFDLLPKSFKVVAPPTAEAGQTFSATITSLNSSGSVETSINGNTVLSVDDGTIAPTTITATAFASGIWTGNITLSKAGTRTITVTNDAANGSATLVIMNAAKNYSSSDLGVPGMSISIPNGAASSEVSITVSEVIAPVEAPAGYMIGGKIFDIKGTPSTFLLPVTITLPINGPLSDPSIYWWDGSKWTRDGIAVVSITNTSITFTVSHFTVFAPMGALSSNLFRFGPNPYNPNKGSGNFWYWLDANKDTSIYLIDLGGAIVWKQTYASGQNGAKQGENNISYDGKTSWGDVLGNGVYLYKIVQDGKSVGSGKIAVIK